TGPDPLLFSESLPLRPTLYPLGCPLVIETNAPSVLDAADLLWSKWPELFPGRVARLRVSVAATAAATPPQPTLPRGYDHLIVTSHGPENHSVCDLDRGLAFACLTQDVARNIEYLNHYFLEPLVCFMLGASHFVLLHAAAVALNGAAILLCGDSGSGKSCFSYACARRGWTFLSGDASQLVRDASPLRIVGRPYSVRFRETARHLFPELSGFPLHRGRNGKLDIDAEPLKLGLGIATDAEIAAIIFLDREPSANTGLTPVSGDEAMAYFRQSLLFGNEELRTKHIAALQRLQTLPKLRLRYSDFDSAERQLRAAIESPVGVV
ncbi:MAG TPA: hypothetical protein VNH18_12675, partial [Bryobacteraceae bacterium]|nr:hypothetical protein [Bryobacteraceae bacterium]